LTLTRQSGKEEKEQDESAAALQAPPRFRLIQRLDSLQRGWHPSASNCCA
jgi:hypothetical protein